MQKVVLDGDGIEIDDDEVLFALQGHGVPTVLLLMDSQQWTIAEQPTANMEKEVSSGAEKSAVQESDVLGM